MPLAGSSIGDFAGAHPERHGGNAVLAVRDDASGDQIAQQLRGFKESWNLGFSSRTTSTGEVVDLARPKVNAFLREIEALARTHALNLRVSFGGLRLIPLRGLNRSRILLRLKRRAPYFRVLAATRAGALLDIIECRMWDRRHGYWITPDRKAPVRRHVLLAGAPAGKQDSGALNSEFSIGFPIDAVFTWVNSDDPKWRELYARFRPLKELDRDRFAQTDELRYAIRSVAQNAPWVRTLYVFSNCAPPKWFQQDERFRWVNHSDVIPERYLPTFNSHAIETYLHHIPALAENFLYLNDDFFLSDRSLPQDFFLFDGRSVAKFEPYGTVSYFLDTEASRAEWMSAAVNGALLLQSRFGIFPTRTHEHMPYALRRSVLQDIEAEFVEAIEHTRANRFRDHGDLSLPSFFYHHYAEIRGLGTAAPARTFLVRPENARAFARKAFGKRKYQAICVNDGNRSASDADFNRFKDVFLNRAFPFAGRCEKAS